VRVKPYDKKETIYRNIPFRSTYMHVCSQHKARIVIDEIRERFLRGNTYDTRTHALSSILFHFWNWFILQQQMLVTIWVLTKQVESLVKVKKLIRIVL